MTNLKNLLILAALAAAPLLALAQELPRRVFVGIRMENLSEDTRKVMNLGSGVKGVLISEPLPNSTARKAGFRKGDILLSVNGEPTASTDATFAVLGRQKAGQPFRYEILRGGKTIKGKTTFQEMPREQYKGLEVAYADSKSPIGLQRTIITKKAGMKGKMPVVAFIGGIGCYSLEFPFDTTRGEVQLTNAMARAGFLTARLEKPGMGDNAKYCKPCSEVSFTEETDGYVAAIKALKRRPDVDSSQVFVFGHSMGGVFGPLVAQKTPLKGIIAYGTIGSNFIEYLAKTRRTIGAAEYMSPEETDDLIKDFCACAGLYFVEKMSTAEAAKKMPACQEYLSVLDLRSRAYMDELYAFNLPAVWKPFTGRALLVYGESDYIASREDHQIIANAIAFYQNGQGTFLPIAGTDHGMNQAASFQEAAKNPGPYNPAVSREVVNWLRGQI